MSPHPHVDVTGPIARPASWVTFVVKATVILAVAMGSYGDVLAQSAIHARQ